MPEPTVAKSPKPRKASVLTMPETERTALTIALEALNHEVCFVHDLNRVAILPTPSRPNLNLVTFEAFVHSVYAHRRMLSGSLSIADEWRKWPGRRTVNSIVYEPGKPPFTPDGNYNEWRPSPIQPIPGPIPLWNRYLDHLFSDDPTYRDWFLAWLAYPLQHPGAKLHTACIFWSTETSTGKSTLGYIIKHLYGLHNYTLLRDSDLLGNFNSWAARRQFVEAEEIRGGASARKIADQMKSMITQHEIRVNEKHKAHYTIRDCINYYFTSNHSDALYLDDSDRRFFVHAVPNRKLPSSFFQDELDPWLKSGGFSAILHHLLSIDLRKPIIGGDDQSLTPAPFKRGGHAPQSSARRSMILESMDDAEAWALDLRTSPANNPAAIGHSIFTARDLCHLYRLANPKDSLGSQALIRRFKRNVVPIGNGNAVQLHTGRRDRMYSLDETLIKLCHTQIKEVYAQEETKSGAIVSC